MGGEQAAHVLATVRRDSLESQGEDWSDEAQKSFINKIRNQYEREGHPYFSSARLWDDGIIDPRETRPVLGSALSLATRQLINVERNRFGIFRM